MILRKIWRKYDKSNGGSEGGWGDDMSVHVYACASEWENTIINKHKIVPRRKYLIVALTS